MSSSSEKIIIIGAGVVGLSTAVELLQHGYMVEIFDQQQAAKAASWAGGGILSPMYPWKYHSAINQLAKFGKQSYLALNEKLQPITGIDFEIEQGGMLIFDHDQFDLGLNYAQHFHEPEQQAYLVHRHEIQKINSQVNTEIDAAVYFPQLSNIRNPRLTQSLLTYVLQHPHARLHTHTPIQKISIAAARVNAIYDTSGNRYRADQYVIATGAWTAQLMAQFNVHLDIQPVHGQMVLYKTPPKWLPTMCMNNTMYLIPRRDGHIVCGSSTNHFGFHQELHEEISQNIIQSALSLVPELSKFPVVKQWAGLRPGSPTGVPKICKIPQCENAWCNAGHYRNGLVMAPASARLLREQMQGLATWVDASPYQWAG
ncbi:FAD-dependent oxidoreductase [Acinetobacter qingfengensis]|uniref:D-amino-acid oxidase n=1 Tax=Acinetobacter qingfengensis TaxID=1262585 RepID=A0A1E7RE09_9GAMM|nr:FAD-dependent oxidoreductase [Acinetobacter qingfengensis]KAA8735284.1 FAD-dependent oxidoreductase [Acinetobacter qingfengensis]OEY97405.1 D-amino-acid oxidase [Acinetobacter qingfengensis]